MGGSSEDNSNSLSPPLEREKEGRKNAQGFLCTPVLMLISTVVIVGLLALSCLITYLFVRTQFEHRLSDLEKGGQSTENLQNATFITLKALRLPKNLKPISYNLVVRVYLPFYVDYPVDKNLTTDGEVVIEIVVLEPTNKIILNMKEIQILSDKCEAHSNGARIPIKSVEVTERFEKVTFVLAETLHVDQKVNLKVVFSGLVNDGLTGLYRTYYNDSQGNPKIAAMTKMEPADARRFVPCFDEPEYKAIWKVTVIHPNGTRAIANAFEISETTEADGKWKVSTFEPTPIMPSYLLAIFVSEFEFDESYTKRGVRFRVWSTPDTKDKRKYGLKAAVTYMETLERYFDIEDVMKKQDLVAIPDYASGATENWGLIAFRTYLLLLTSLPNSTNINDWTEGTVIAHELAHQWLGNLVTMKWWDELWIKEGFANYFENMELNENRDMRIIRNEIVAGLDYSMEKDSLAASRPISSIMDMPIELAEIYDILSYDKAGSIISMIHDVIGEQNFRKAMIHYLKKFAFKNTCVDDLWKAFDEVVEGVEGPDGRKLNLVDVGGRWSKQMGFPLVTVEHFNSTTLKIKQERYLKNPKAIEPQKYISSNYGYKWDVPLWYQWDDKQLHYKWLKRDEPLYIQMKPKDVPIVINADRRSYLAQNYDAEGWKKIIKQLRENHEVYTPYTRYAIISDAFTAALIDRVDYKIVFDLLNYLSKEEDHLVWRAVERAFRRIKKLFGNKRGKEYFHLYTNQIMEKRVTRMYSSYIRGQAATAMNGSSVELKHLQYGWKEGSTGALKSLSSMELKYATSLVEFYCEGNASFCSSAFRSLFETEVLHRCTGSEKASQCVRIPKPFRRSTYCQGVKQLGSTAIGKIKSLYKNEDDAEEKDNLMKGLTCAQKIEHLKGLLRMAIDKNGGVPVQSISRIFNRVALNPLSNDFLTHFLFENWKAICNRLKNHERFLQRVIGACLLNMHSNAEIMLVKQYRKIIPVLQQSNIVKVRLEEAEHRIRWLEKHSKKLIKFFKSVTSNA
ncbi:hypothetical protein RB195_016186 [Necator americanus]|uniref:Aminopeptidase n=1 Tax=Necator americanus TaxID=51031 RepID=A0ABR1E866_NECAM